MARPGWAASIDGDAADLLAWQDNLKEPNDLWIEIHESEAVLRSVDFDQLTSPDQVREQANVLIGRLNGAFAALELAEPIRFAHVMRVESDGTIRRYRYLDAEAGHYTVRPGSATFAHLGPDGQPVPSQPQCTDVQRWAKIARRHERLGDALTYSRKDPDWPDIYKACECVIDDCKLWKLKLPEGLKGLKRAANLHRHDKNRSKDGIRSEEQRFKKIILVEGRSRLHHVLRRAFENVNES